MHLAVCTVELAYKSLVGDSEKGSYIRVALVCEVYVKHSKNLFLSTLAYTGTYMDAQRVVRAMEGKYLGIT